MTTIQLRVGDFVRANGRLGTVTYVTPFAVTVCTGPTAFDQIHPAPADVRLVMSGWVTRRFGAVSIRACCGFEKSDHKPLIHNGGKP